MSVLKGVMPDAEIERHIDRDSGYVEGTTRRVFGVNGDPETIIKEAKVFHLANMIEWIVWYSLVKMGEDIVGNTTNTSLINSFGRCWAISTSGKYLVMERLYDLSPDDKVPNTPVWLNDRKRSAFGRDRNGNVKVRDYGMVEFYSVLNPLNTQM